MLTRVLAVARRFAGLQCKVSIAGRSENRAKSVLWEMNLANPGPLGKFYKVDLSSMKDVERFTEEVTRDVQGKGIDYLVLSAGGPPTGKWRTSPEVSTNFCCLSMIPTDDREWKKHLQYNVYQGIFPLIVIK
jgi:NAD(P)-dependent dehydrogenase (short-subunit alcohol dehydrogenase family)